MTGLAGFEPVDLAAVSSRELAARRVLAGVGLGLVLAAGVAWQRS
jgi:hypothetical protein